jgi:hypothetical protein
VHCAKRDSTPLPAAVWNARSPTPVSPFGFRGVLPRGGIHQHLFNHTTHHNRRYGVSLMPAFVKLSSSERLCFDHANPANVVESFTFTSLKLPL